MALDREDRGWEDLDQVDLGLEDLGHGGNPSHLGQRNLQELAVQGLTVQELTGIQKKLWN